VKSSLPFFTLPGFPPLAVVLGDSVLRGVTTLPRVNPCLPSLSPLLGNFSEKFFEVL